MRSYRCFKSYKTSSTFELVGLCISLFLCVSHYKICWSCTFLNQDVGTRGL